MTTNGVVVPLTAVLCTAISSVISSLVTALVMCYCIMKRKKKGSSEDDKHNPPIAEPVCDISQVFGENSTDIELKGNIPFTSKSDGQ